ncbi:hypothetical protein BJX64DRAFT_259971 [Aspergillus heterothallicus]
MSSSATCTGAITFNEVSSNAVSEWPSNLAGYICKTPPTGPNSSPRLPHCCSGPVYNITSPTTPDDPGYPMTCATICQVDPALDKLNDNNPYGWSDFFMCLIDGGRLTSDQSEVVCGEVDVEGETAPTHFSSTPTWDAWSSYWTSVVYTTDDRDHTAYLNPLTHWVALTDYVTVNEASTSSVSESGSGSGSSGASATATPSHTSAESSTAETSEAPSTTSAPTESSLGLEGDPTPTTSGSTSLGIGRLARALAVFGLLGTGLWQI